MTKTQYSIITTVSLIAAIIAMIVGDQYPQYNKECLTIAGLATLISMIVYFRKHLNKQDSTSNLPKE